MHGRFGEHGHLSDEEISRKGGVSVHAITKRLIPESSSMPFHAARNVSQKLLIRTVDTLLYSGPGNCLLWKVGCSRVMDIGPLVKERNFDI